MKTSSSLLVTSLALAVSGLGSSPADAALSLPALFSDHAVLQSGRAVPVWGTADPGAEVSVSIAGQTKAGTADDQGGWRVMLDALKPGGPFTLTVRSKADSTTISDVLVGEVWLGSGQSNMAFTVSRARDYERERTEANLPQIRVFREESTSSATPSRQARGRWVVCSSETVGTFSATAFFFGRELNETLRVPVGLVVSAVGGTPIESWIAPEVQRGEPTLKPFFAELEKQDQTFDEAGARAQYEKQLARWKEAAAKAKAAEKPVPKKPRDPVAVRARKGEVGGLLNGKIAPLIPYAIRGVLWYQGEANTVPSKGPFYERQLRLLVRDWRARWGEGDMPFAWVQLPNFNAPGRDWVLVREAMRKALDIPQTGMVVTIDVGDPTNIHPTNKQAVGKRLALWALATVYNRAVASSGPLPVAMKTAAGEIEVTFAHDHGGLVAKDGALRGFELKGNDGHWVKADARIVGATVVVANADVRAPVAVRYAWANVPDANLYNAADLPASPFTLGE